MILPYLRTIDLYLLFLVNIFHFRFVLLWKYTLFNMHKVKYLCTWNKAYDLLEYLLRNVRCLDPDTSWGSEVLVSGMGSCHWRRSGPYLRFYVYNSVCWFSELFKIYVIIAVLKFGVPTAVFWDYERLSRDIFQFYQWIPKFRIICCFSFSGL